MTRNFQQEIGLDRHIIARVPIVKRMLGRHMLDILDGAAIAFVVKVLGAALAFFFNVLLTRFFGAEGAGVYYISFTVVSVAVVFGRFGLDNAMMRFVASYSSVGDWSAVKGVYRKGISIALLSSSFCAVVVFFSAPLIMAMLFSIPDGTGPLRLMAFAVVPVVVLTVHGEILKGIMKIRDSTLVLSVGVPLFSCAVLFIVGDRNGVMGAIIAYLAAAILTALASYALWNRWTPELKDAATDNFSTSTLFGSSIPLLWAWVMNLMMNWTATFILGYQGTSVDVGIFNVANRTALLIGFILTAVNSILAPKFASLYQQGDWPALARLAKHSTYFMIVISTPVVAFFLIAPRTVMSLFGPDFAQQGASTLMILTVGQFINVASGAVGYLLMMTGNERLLKNIFMITSLLNIAISYALIYVYGLTGAAIASTLSLTVFNILAIYMAKVRLGISTVPFVRSSY